MTKERDRLWSHAQEALAASNHDRYSAFKKELVITTFVHGPKADLHFEAKIPRASTNELGMTVSWCPEAREEIASFLRDLADLIRTGSEGTHKP